MAALSTMLLLVMWLFLTWFIQTGVQHTGGGPKGPLAQGWTWTWTARCSLGGLTGLSAVVSKGPAGRLQDACTELLRDLLSPA